MKKTLFSVLSFLMLCIGMQAQTTIANYTFAKSIGSYSALSTPTVLGAATAVTGATTSLDGTNYRVAFPSGFTFSYDGVAQTDININSNGYIGFATAIWTGNTTSPLANNPAGGTTTGIISGFARDLNAVYNPAGSVIGDISYELIGSAPDRVLVVQFKNFKPYSGSVDGRLLNFQIQLFESTHTSSANHIAVVYGNCVIDNGTSTDIKVGIRGNSLTWLGNVNNIMIDNVPAGTTCDWMSASTGNSNTSNMVFTSANTNISIPNGLTYRWAPPAVSIAPVRVFNAVSGITSSDANLAWTAATGATQYNVQYRTQGSCSWTNFSGNPVSTNSATLTGLNPATVYQIRVQSSDGTNKSIWSHIPTAAGGSGTNGFIAAGTFSTLGIPVDLQTSSLQAPAVNATGCYGSAVPVIIQIRNAGTGALDFSTNNATVITSISGPNPQTFTTTVNTGTLAAGATQTVMVTSSYNMSAVGVYSIDAVSTLATPDANTANDAMAVVTRTTTSGTPAPYTQDFSAGVTPAGWVNTSSWSFAANHGVTNNGMYFNLWSSATSASFNLLKLGTLTGSENLAFDLRILNYSSTYPGTQVPPTGNWGDLKIQVSTDCGVTFSTIATIDNTTHTITTQAWTNKMISLSAYAGQNVIIKFLGTWVAGDYFIDLDNFNIASCFAPTGLSTSNIMTTAVDIAWVAPAAGTPVQYIGEIRTSGAAGSGTLGLVSTGTITAPTTTANITPLTPATAYTVYVRSDCGAGDMSPWTSVTFTTMANCPVPTALNTSTVLATSANFTWTAGATETAWDIYYGSQPLTAPDATTAPTATSSAASYSATGLTQMTPYSVYVRANCGAGNTSIWTAVKNFTTPASCPMTSFPLITSTTPTSAVATWTAGGSETSWMVRYTAPTTTVLAGPTPSYTLTGLTPSTVYTIQVKGICGVGDSSAWTAPVISFTTPCLPPDILSTMPGSRCGVGTVTIGATTNVGATLNWYTNSTGGSSVGTGSVYTTPSLTTTTDFYVSSTGAITSGTGARTAPTATSSTTPSSYGLVFDALKTFTLNSVDVFPTGVAGNLVINLTNNAGAVLQTATVAIPTGTVGTPYTVALNFSVAPGPGYRLIAVSGPSMIRESALGGFPYPLGQVGNINSGYISGTSTTYYFFYNWQFSYGCESARTAVTASVIAAPALTLNSPAPICGGSEVGTFSVTSNVSDYDTYIWSPTANIYSDAAGTVAYTGTNATDVYVKSNASGVVTINANATNSITGCAAVASTTIMIKNAPTSMTVTATPSVICAGSTTSLSGMANPVQVVLLNEGFNAPTNSWTKLNTSTGGTTASAAWTLRTSPFTSGVGTGISSNDASQFYLTDSDAQGNGGTTSTVLQSPAINTMGMNSLNLSFFHYYNYYTSDVSAKVEVSTNGSSWTALQDYKTAALDVGAPGTFAPANFSLNSYINNPTLYIRFNYNSAWGYGWAIDNVMINGTSTSDYAYSWTSSPAGFTSNSSTTTAMPTGTTDYSVVITNTTTSCSNSGVVTVSVNPVPTVTVSASSTSVCAGSTATLTAGGATTFTWTSGGTTSTEVVTVSSASVYTVTGTDNGCSNTATVGIGVNPVPVVSASATQTLLCDDGSTGSSILTASSTATSFMWSDGAMTMTTSVTPTTTTVYTVTATEAGCSADATVTVMVSNCNGIKESFANGINVYPNPTNGVLNISISSELAGNASIEVYDAIGKLVIKDTLSNDANTINLSKLEDGMYVFKIINNNKAIKVGKVVKQ